MHIFRLFVFLGGRDGKKKIIHVKGVGSADRGHNVVLAQPNLERDSAVFPDWAQNVC